jgi:hypothetical protein
MANMVTQVLAGSGGSSGMMSAQELVQSYLGSQYVAIGESKIKSTPRQTGGIPTAAGGGYISGAGTPTSDSIPARLSNGEYVVKASSVGKYGVGMMDQINAGTFAMGGIVRNPMMPRYNMGGKVMNYATGGSVGGNTYNINISADGVSDVNKLADIIVKKIDLETSRRQHSRSMG